MPSQTDRNGIWSCDVCQMSGFRSADEARHHERECSTKLSAQTAYSSPPSSATRPSRQMTILGLEDRLPDLADTVACQNLELVDSVGAKIGIRCLHCASHQICPEAVAHMASCVRRLSEEHLAHCDAVPSRIRSAVSVRRKQHSSEEESHFAALMDHCIYVAHHLRIMDKYPPKSGIMFAPPEFSGHAAGGTPYQQKQPPTPYQPQRPPTMDAPIAATPLARRKDRPPQHSPYSIVPQQPPAERSEAVVHTPAMQQKEAQSKASPPAPPPSPYAQQHPSHYDMQPQTNFPYFQDVSGSWFCKYCSHVHPQYRDQGFVWNSPKVPSSHFIDQHLLVCRYYNTPPGYGYYPGYSQPYGAYWGRAQYPAIPMDAQLPPPYPVAVYPPPEPSTGPERLPPPISKIAGSAPGQPEVMPSEPSDAVTKHAINVLMQSDLQHFGSNPRTREARGQLVLEEDRLLLTEYFFHLMRQLRLVRFAEADRKTRGGKRESIAVGYGGLQCVHCTDAPNSRKFFWSNVDRLANSFAEIPGHVLKCRHCPTPVKEALVELKKKHSKEMTTLPRGSQKVFFRRLWRRLHDEDPQTKGSIDERVTAPKPDLTVETSESYSPATSAADDSPFSLDRTTADAAKALGVSHSPPLSPSSRVLLAISEDKEWLSDMDCFIRRNIEVFCANDGDIKVASDDRKYPVREGQVGIRCIHCALAEDARGAAVAYPYSVTGIYESVREFQRLHLETCQNIPPSTKSKLEGFKGSASLSSVLRKYYVLAAQALGLHDTSEGIRSTGRSVPLGSSAASVFTFQELTPKVAMLPGEPRKPAAKSPGSEQSNQPFLRTAVTPLERRKRDDDGDGPGTSSSKKSRTG